MTTATWKNGTSGDWATAAAWSTGIAPDDLDTDVLISVPGTYTVSIGTGETFSAATVQLIGSASTLSISGALTLDQLFAGYLPTGPVGSGAFQAANGGQVEINGNAYVWSGSTLSVDSTSEIDLGGSGTYVAGELLIDAGAILAGNGLISATVGSNGIIEALYTPSGTLVVTGTVTGSGSIFVAANASALFENSVTTQALAIGADGTLTINGHLLIASNVVDSFATIDTGGELIVNGPATQGISAISAVAGAGASLTVTVDGGLLEAMNGALVVGISGNATLTVINGGSVSSTTEFATDSALVVGGTVQVNGVGSALTALGQIVVGYNGAGKLSVQSGGTVFSGNSPVSSIQGLVIGQYSGSGGAVTVQGTGSELVNVGQFLVGGNTTPGGVGLLFVNGGGLVQTSRVSASLTAPAAGIGYYAGDDGSQVSVSGTDSTWSVSGPLVVGGSAAGFLVVTTNGTVDAGSMDLGLNASGAGNVSVVGTAGTASFITISGALTVGDAGIGELSIVNGATITAATTIDVGNQAGSSGNIVIEGAGSTLSTNTDDALSTINVGVSGTAVVTLGNDTELNASLINIGPNGVINSFGGTIDPVTLTNTGVLGGTGLFNGSIHNLGTVYASGGTYEVTGSIDQGPGTLELETGGTLELGGPVTSGQTVDFTASGGLILNDVTGFDPGVVEGSSGTNGTIDVPIPGATGTLDGTTFTIYNAAEQPLTSFQVSGGIDLSVVATCFSQGTRINTPHRMVAVEDLSEGDSVLTASGTVRTVQWLGHRRVQTRNHPRPQDIMPVRVMAHAFAENQPSRDLFLSPDHSVFVGGVLIPVRYLLNGTTISQQRVDAVTYWHVELADHDIILAEGLPCESYLETGNRGAFANGGTAVQMNPDFARSVWDAKGCAPLTMRGPKLESARAHLLARLPALGWRLTGMPNRRFLADGRDPIEPQVSGDWCCIALPDGVSTLRITSRHTAPAETDPASFDWRRLGVALTHLRVDDQPIRLDDPRFIRGWHSPESGLRWSDGAGDIHVVEARIVELKFAPGLIRHAVPTRSFRTKTAARA